MIWSFNQIDAKRSMQNDQCTTIIDIRLFLGTVLSVQGA